MNNRQVVLFLIGAALLLIAVRVLPTTTAQEGTSIDGSTYTSPTWDFTLEWDDNTWMNLEAIPDAVAEDRTSTEGIDRLDEIGLLHYGDHAGSLFIRAFHGAPPLYGDAENCLSFEAELLAASEGISNVRPAIDSNGNTMGGTTDHGGAYGIYTYHYDTMPDDADPASLYATYIECRPLVENEAVVSLEYTNALDHFDVGIADALVVFDSLVAPSAPVVVETGVDGDSYTSPTWGFSVKWNADAWTPSEVSEIVAGDFTDEDGTSAVDELVLAADGANPSDLTIRAYRGAPAKPGDAAACLEFELSRLADNGVISNLEPVLDEAGQPLSGVNNLGGVYGVYRYDAWQPWIAYLECRTLVTSEAAISYSYVVSPTYYNDGIEDAIQVIDSTILANEQGPEVPFHDPRSTSVAGD